MTSGRLLLAVALLTLALRFWLAQALPITGDEAYFIWWGKFPDWGFYDHPPLIGWWLAVLLAVTDVEWWLRMPQVLQPLLLMMAVRWAWPHLWPDRRDDRDKVALLVLLAPVNVWNVLITTDTALVYCAVLSGLAWLRATRDDDPRWYLVAGLFLAGAVLSKYFAALLGFAYLVDALRRRARGAWIGLAIAYVCTLPALGLMAWWNSGHCWTNYLFNFVNRHGSGNTGLAWKHPLLYVLTLAYVLTPPVLWQLFRRRPTGADQPAGRRTPCSGGPECGEGCGAAESSLDKTLAVLAIVPLLLFALLSLVKTIGLHWVLAFVPFALMLAARRMAPTGLRRLVLFLGGVAALHAALLFGVARLPLETWRTSGYYASAVLTFDSRALAERAAPGASLLVSDGYSNAVTLGYNLRRYVPVLGLASSHARHDDILTDWRVHDGRDITVLRKTAPAPGEYDRWFRRVTIDSFEHRGARFWVVRGRGFDYAAYRDDVLMQVRQRYYAIPRWLPQRGCYFCDRYFEGQGCTR